MNVSGVNNQYTPYYGTTSKTAASSTETASKGNSAGASVEISEDGKKAYDSNKGKDGSVTVKEEKKNVGKMSAQDRAALVQQLKSDAQSRTQSLLDLVRNSLGTQSKYAAASDDSIWKLLASGKFTVDEKTRAEAQAAISEDGYWGVKQTSERLFQFAQALAGDDVDKMQEMQKAIEKGYKMATGTWGRELPSICKDTLDNVNQMFSDFYQSKGVEV